MIRFLTYIIRYFTHHTLAQIKKGKIPKDGKWHLLTVTCWVHDHGVVTKQYLDGLEIKK